MRIILFIFLLLITFNASAVEVLNIYNWSGYLPDEVARQFEKETGITIHYSTYDSNETLYAKLKADPGAAYDIVVPSTYFIDRMRRQEMLKKIDKSKITGFKNLNPDLLNKPYDPNNDYSIPYLWGTTGIVVNSKEFLPDSITSWEDLWKPIYKDQLLLLNDTREIFSMALLTLGYSVNETDPEYIKQAYEKLKLLMPNAKLFNGEAVQHIYLDEDVMLGMGWSGDIYLAARQEPAIKYIYPKEGFVIWVDSIAIPKGAKHIENAYKFINFVLRPDIAKKIGMGVGFASPNLAAVALMPVEVRTNPIIYPDRTTLNRGQFQDDVGTAANIYERYLELLKIGA